MKKNIIFESNIAKKYITISWFLSSFCNYNCHYCPDRFHNGNSFPNNFDNFIKFIKQVKIKYPSKIIRISLKGGEVTYWNKLPLLLKELNKLKAEVSIISNGSQTEQWWDNNLKYFHEVILTYHHNNSDVNQLIKISKIIKIKGFVFLPLTPTDFNEILSIGKYISESSKVLVIPKVLRNGQDWLDYNEEQLNIINKKIIFGQDYLAKNSNHKFINISSIGSNLSIMATDVLINNINHFKNWKCSGGIDLFYINEYGDIFVGECGKGLFGNINKEVILPNKYFICNQEKCNCILDLESTTKILY